MPRFNAEFDLGYADALLVQLASHPSYLLFAVPITIAVVRAGYMRAIAAGLIVMAAACLAFAGASSTRGFTLVLAALLLLSLGITFLQIAVNTVVAVAGATGGSAARLTLLQGFNSLGTVLGPLLAAPLLLARSRPGDPGLGLPAVVCAVVLAGLAAAFVVQRDLLPQTPARTPRLRHVGALLHDRRLAAGMAAMFAYVGAEVTIGALLTNYLMRRDILGIGAVDAGGMVSLY